MVKAREDVKILGVIPQYSIVYVLVYLFFVSFCFFVPGLLNKKYVFIYYLFETEIDRLIPFLPIFIIPCILFFPFFIVGPFYISLCNRHVFIRFIASAVVGSILSCVTFFVRPSCTSFCINYNNTFLGFIFLFFSKFGLRGVNFPSIVSFLSFLIFIAANNCISRRDVKSVFFVLTLLICFSSIFVKWFTILDITGGVVLAEISWAISNNSRLLKLFRY